jgi:hypothetical protein
MTTNATTNAHGLPTPCDVREAMRRKRSFEAYGPRSIVVFRFFIDELVRS